VLGQPAKGSDSQKTIYVPHLPERILAGGNSKKDLIVIYGDTTTYSCGTYECDLSCENYTARLTTFFQSLTSHYTDCRLIYKPHPVDHGQVMAGLENLRLEVYHGDLTSPMHLEENISRIKACYSVASTSLLDSAQMLIPSYSLYRYLQFNSEYPKTFFENDEAKRNPYLYNIEQTNELGKIDLQRVAFETSGIKTNWDIFN